MGNKIFNLFAREGRFGIRLLVIFILAFLSIYTWNMANSKSKELKKAEQTGLLIASVPAMEQELNDMENSHALGKSALDTCLPVINGILIQDESPILLSGDNFFKEGDAIGKYIIFKITQHKVILKDKVSNLQKEIEL